MRAKGHQYLIPSSLEIVEFILAAKVAGGDLGTVGRKSEERDTV